jgi:hypothetical protein
LGNSETKWNDKTSLLILITDSNHVKLYNSKTNIIMSLESQIFSLRNAIVSAKRKMEIKKVE